MSRLRVGLALGLVWAMGLTGCTRELDMEKLAGVIRSGLSSKTGLPVKQVQCPPSRTQRAGDSFECTAITTSGARLTVTVTQKDDLGNVRWDLTAGAIDLTKLQARIAAGLREQTGLDTRVDCGGRFREARSGQSFDCTARGQVAARFTVEVDQQDGRGNVTWKVTTSHGVLGLRKLEARIAESLRVRLGLNATVDCGGVYREADPGKSFDCRATDAKGESASVAVTMKDAEGNVHWRLAGSTAR